MSRIGFILDCRTWPEIASHSPLDRHPDWTTAFGGVLVDHTGRAITVADVDFFYLFDDACRLPSGGFAAGVSVPAVEVLEAELLLAQVTDVVLVGPVVQHFFATQYGGAPVGLRQHLLPEPGGMASIAWFQKLDGIITAVGGQAPDASPLAQVTHELVTDLGALDAALEECLIARTFCFDFETTGLEYWDAAHVPTLLAFAAQPGHVYIVPLYHTETDVALCMQHLPPDTRTAMVNGWVASVVERVAGVLADQAIDKVAHNAKFDLHWWRRLGVSAFRGRWYDTMLMAHLLDENRKVGLKELTRQHVPAFAGYDLKLKPDEWRTVAMERGAPDAAVDVHLTLLFKTRFERALLELGSEVPDHRLYLYYRHMSVPLLFALEEAEFRGASIDVPFLDGSLAWAAQQEEVLYAELMAWPEVFRFEAHERRLAINAALADYAERAAKHKPGSHLAEHWARKAAGVQDGSHVVYEGFNPASDQQLARFIYSRHGLGLKPPRDASTSRDVLKDYDHEWLELLAAWKQVGKMRGTYYVGLRRRVDDRGHLHGNLNQTGTKTYRLSSSDPNLQNLPVRTQIKHPVAVEAVQRVKRFFKVQQGRVLVACDMSQAELRAIANVSGDKAMIEAYRQGIDLHTLTASRIYGCSYEEFLQLMETDPKTAKHYRTMAKGGNFGMVYGVSPEGYMAYLAGQYGVIITEAEERVHRRAIFTTYGDLLRWHATFKAKARKFGYVRSIFGTKRRLPDIYANRMGVVAKAERDAINNPVQSTAAQYCLFAMALLRLRLPPSAWVFNQIHDAVYIDCDERHVDHVLHVIRDTFTNLPIHLFGVTQDKSPVPMAVDLEVGPSWAETKPAL